MMDELNAALGRFVDAESRLAASTAPDAGAELGLLTRRVRRRRAVRAGATSVTALALVGGVVGGVQALQHRSGQPAVGVPSASERPSVAPEPSPQATATDSTAAPTMAGPQPMPAGMLDTTDPTWRMIRYQGWADAEADGGPPVLLLLAPDGRTFEVPTPDAADWYLVDWLPGTPLAIVTAQQSGATAVIDLITGGTSTILDIPTWTAARFARDGTHDILHRVDGALHRVSADGVTAAGTPPFRSTYGSEPWLLSPGGSRILLNDEAGVQAVAAASLLPVSFPQPYESRPEACRAWMWVSEGSALLECSVDGAGPFAVGSASEFWLVDLDGGEPRRLPGMPEATQLGGVWLVGDRLVAGRFGPAMAAAEWWEISTDGAHLRSTGGTAELDVLGVVGSELMALARPHEDAGTPSVASLVAIDPVTGTTRTLFETPPFGLSSVSVEPRTVGGAPQTEIGD